LKFEGTQKSNDNLFLNKNFPLSWRLLFFVKKKQLSPKEYFKFILVSMVGKFSSKKKKKKKTPTTPEFFYGSFWPF
jgi:hypothetical protein